jgi:hypothetical protein
VIGAILSGNGDDDSFDRILVNNGCIVIPEETKLLSRFKFGIVSCNEDAIEVEAILFKDDVNSNSEDVVTELLGNLFDEAVIILGKFVVVLFCSLFLLLLLWLL